MATDVGGAVKLMPELSAFRVDRNARGELTDTRQNHPRLRANWSTHLGLKWRNYAK